MDPASLQAVHVILPPPRHPSQDVWGDGGILADVSGMEAIFEPSRVRSFRARKQLFLALVLIGALLYVVAFVGEWEGGAGDGVRGRGRRGSHPLWSWGSRLACTACLRRAGCAGVAAGMAGLGAAVRAFPPFHAPPHITS